MKQHKHTLFGVAAILLWSCLMGLIRTVTEQFSPIGGAALIYTVSSVFLMLVMGVPKFKHFSLRYVLIGGALFVSYEICLALALGMANDRHQALEMAVINYLWPALTVLFAVFLSRKPVHILVYPSVALAFVGVAWTITGDSGFSVIQISANIATNPLTYSMAFGGAIIWAVYCNITKQLANGQNAIILFFMATAIALWIKYFLSSESTLVFTVPATLNLALTGVVMGSGYALWNVAILRGNMVLLATLSYFTPVISTLLSSLILGVALGLSFWQGVIMVTMGSLICWWATRERQSTVQEKMPIA
ncbi:MULTISPECIES: aromatic amino acid DMT transporter YddG [unclassified Vibrio]|uniref:aromatic amino acid DMT transporter YddG n=1 Tax=unclassified Vibrio TaxID=2614977 RepID=UPI00148287C5|nr:MULTISPECIES: aromatic amino acid DMT transporter YddG [unclassified Vibrio]MDQ2190705.1 drug/metabolite DMT transporter permease [Vibrio sp. A14(2019)]MDQ2196914.1 drug/metabolite DMT transporter permease [Vibrio sp. 2017_1457_11]NNN75243.1 drug/metabolite DMT transporter permease [Vibrio sp. B7]NNN92182.1 drug/metabolite DMT transporter permease [Vibrio sp. B8-1]NNO07482.1 drug/metabolite DMT transporter permease [Vibrio sp. B4-12]